MDFMDFTTYGFESDLRRLFKRCVVCPSESPPCPVCPSGQFCSQIQPTCDHCLRRVCVNVNSNVLPTSSASPNPQAQSGRAKSNVPAIAGGIVAGVVFIAILAFLIWRFCIKNRQADFEEEFENSFEHTSEQKAASANMASPNIRASTHTMGSVASTTMTRSSNVIPIAFIPGITGGYDLVPPVPAVPSPAPNTPRSAATMQDHYFLPRDLRDSAYSGFSDTTNGSGNRFSTAPSITPSLLRQSVASTIFQSEAHTGTAPAQTVQRGKAAVVTLQRSGQATPKQNSPTIPAVPEIDYAKYGVDQPRASPAPPIAEGSGSVVPSVSNTRPASEAVVHAQSAVDGSSSSSAARNSSANLKATIEDATRRASKPPTHGGLGSIIPEQQDQPSPFSDDNALPSSSPDLL